MCGNMEYCNIIWNMVWNIVKDIFWSTDENILFFTYKEPFSYTMLKVQLLQSVCVY